MPIKKIKITDLVQDNRNLNKGTERGKELIETSVGRFGAGRSVLIDKNNRIIAGNKTQEAAIAKGIKDVIVVETDGTQLVAVKRNDVDLDSKDGREMALADNATVKADLEWDTEELNAVAEDFGIDMEAWDVDLDGMAEDTTEAEEDDFDEEQDEVKTVAKRGDIFELGNHRLMCGDSTDADAVAKLMNGERADLVFTDPPYGMNLTPNYKSIHKNHQAKAVDYQPIIGDQDVFDARFIFDLFEDTKEMFLWGADYFRHTIPLGGGWFVWDKTCGKHEGRIGNEFELCWSKQQHKKEIIRIQWAGFVGMEEEDGARVHPTQKPVRLAGWFLSKYSKDGDIVADIFGGSGTTMIACEQLGRKCRMMELDPHYCAVIIARWEKLTGQQARKI